MPRTGPSKVPIYVAMTALAFFALGFWLSETPIVFAARLAAALDAQWRSLGMPGELSDAMFYAGMAVAMTLVLSYVLNMGTRDPRTRRYKAR